MTTPTFFSVRFVLDVQLESGFEDRFGGSVENADAYRVAVLGHLERRVLGGCYSALEGDPPVVVRRVDGRVVLDIIGETDTLGTVTPEAFSRLVTRERDQLREWLGTVAEEVVGVDVAHLVFPLAIDPSATAVMVGYP